MGDDGSDHDVSAGGPARESAWGDRMGLCSVTLRHLPALEVVDRAAGAGLRRIEWGADVHARPDDPALEEIRDATTAAGLVVSSYGTYWRAGRQRAVDAGPLLRAATVLGAPRIRVWAGDLGTPEATPEWWAVVTDDLRAVARLAADAGITVGLEFHPGTLTDSVESTRRLLERVDHPALSTYWQPRLDEAAGPATAGLEQLLDVVCAVHVFSWWPGSDRRRLSERGDLWSGVLDLLTARVAPLDLLLEFVPDDDAGLLAAEAATLRGWLP